MSYTKKTTHIAEGLANLIEEFKNKPRIRELITVFLQQIQDIEDKLAELLTETTIDTAVGQQLDNIGEVVGEDRSGRSDALYRTALRAKILINQSQGAIENIISVVKALIGDVDIEYSEDYPAGFRIDITEPIDTSTIDTVHIGSLIASSRAGGVRGILTYYPVGAFKYDIGPGYDNGKFGTAIET